MDGRMPEAHLLLVDDAPEVRAIVTVLSNRAGYRSDTCPSVASAWEFLQHTRPTLILLDVQMPPVSGVELCRLVRAAEPLQNLPIALFTHWGVPGDILAGLEAGADYVFSKELLADPVAWQRRAGEILRRVQDSPKDRIVTSSQPPSRIAPAPPANWVDILNQSLHHTMIRRVGREVSRIVVQRAVRKTLPAALDSAFPEWTPWLDRPEAVFSLAAALADQLECLLGVEESTSFRAALAPLLPGADSQVP